MRFSKNSSYLVMCMLLASACAPQTEGDVKISSAPDTPLVTKLPERTLLRIQKNPSREQKAILRAFDKLALDEIVTRQKIQDISNAQTAKARAVIMQQFISLDKDGDAQITAQEMISVNDSQITQWRNHKADYMPYGEADLNKDDIISLKESFVFSQKYASTVTQGYQPYETMLTAFDTNNDGNITRSEVINELNKLSVEDASNTSEKSQVGKALPLRSTKNSNTSRKTLDTNALYKTAPAACVPSAPEKNAEVIFLSGYEGSGLSSVAVTGPDRTTEVARVIIEKGDRPLYIMASSYTPLIWSIEGDTKRVSKFVAGRNRYKVGAGAGVIGLPQNKVEFLGRDCLSYFYKEKDSKKILARAQWGRLIDREPDKIFGAYTLNSIQLPSGNNTSKKETKKKRRLTIIGGAGDDIITVEPDNGVRVVTRNRNENDFGLYRYNVEGLIEIDPKAVISPEPVQTYDVMPQEAGLMQLVKTGQLEALERGSFRIAKPIARFPAGLAGAHGVKFILGKGVPLPKGNPGHSSVLSEESGECLTQLCR